MFFSCRSLTAVIILLALTLLPGCGRKTVLVPPQKLVPVTISDLRYFLDESGVSLKWTYPAKMENGDELHAIESFEVLRAGFPEEEYCQGCPIQFAEPVSVDGGALPATGESRTATYIEADLQDGYRYLYKVRSRAGWWYPSSDSNIISFTWRTPPEIPRGLRLEAWDRTLALSWEPVKENIAGAPLGQVPMYQVYRKSGEAQFIALGEPVQGLKFIDTGLNNDMLYYYRVRTLATFADTLQTGGASQEISGVPLDLAPPAQPRHLVAIETPVGIKLAWQAVSGDDLAGYRIYRREEKSAEPELIAEVGSDQNQYVDQTMNAGGKWFYSVTSFDKAQPPNESLPGTESVIDLQ
jgi:hypothetical protein